jgi:hypothetical protein
LTLGLGAVATNLFLHGSLPWVQKRAAADPAGAEAESHADDASGNGEDGREPHAKGDGPRVPGKVPSPAPKAVPPKSQRGAASFDGPAGTGKHRAGKNRKRRQPAGPVSPDQAPASAIAI